LACGGIVAYDPRAQSNKVLLASGSAREPFQDKPLAAFIRHDDTAEPRVIPQ